MSLLFMSCRCAVHFNSRKAKGKDKSLYKLLQTATVHISHYISKSLSLKQGPTVYTVEDLEANFHMDVVDDHLMLYVPAEKQKMEACYLEELPKHIFNFFEISDEAAEAVLIKILGSSSLEMVDNVLEKAGIVEVKGVYRPVDGDISIARVRTDSVLDTRTQQPPNRANGARSTPRQNTTAHTHAADIDLPDSRNDERDNAEDIVSDWRRSLRTHSPGSQIFESIEQPVENAAYAALLDRLIGTARNAYIPLCDSASHCFCSHTPELAVFNCSDYHIDYPSIFTMRSLDRDRRVGAAGELFVSPNLYLKQQSAWLTRTPPPLQGRRAPPPPRSPQLQRHRQLAQHSPQGSARVQRLLHARTLERCRDLGHRVPRHRGSIHRAAAREGIPRRRHNGRHRQSDILH